MSSRLPGDCCTVSGRNRADEERERIDLRASKGLVARARRQAQRLNMPLSVYIRQAMTRAVEQDEASDPEIRKPSAPKT